MRPASAYMTSKFTPLSDNLYAYLVENWLREDTVLAQLRKETAGLEMARMQIAPLQGQFMSLLVTMLGAKKILEIGTFTGYSALAMARALPQEGSIVCCDISEEWTNIALKYWHRAKVDSKIQLRLAPALDTLDDLLKTEAHSFDLAFIDADKENYDSYYEKCLELLKPGGVLLLDNVFWGGSVTDASDQEKDTIAIRHINRKIHDDDRVEIAIVPIADGLTIARKK